MSGIIGQYKVVMRLTNLSSLAAWHYSLTYLDGGVSWRDGRGEDAGQRDVEDEKAGGRGEMKRERIHNE